MNKYTEVLQKAVSTIETGVTITKKLYDELESENHHSLCALMDAIALLEKDKQNLIALTLADISVLLIENDYLETVQIDENIRQRLLRARGNLSCCMNDYKLKKESK